jgi:hypothetical protein
VPAPSHVAGSVATLPEQLPALQVVPDDGYPHVARTVPSHLPPHDDPSEAHGARVPCGDPLTVVHTPREPGTSHASH